MQPRERLVRVARPGPGERASEIVFFGDEVFGSIEHAPRLDEKYLRVGGQDVGQQTVAVDQPWQPALHAIEVGSFGQPFPLFATPRLAGHQAGSSFAHIVGRHELAGWKDGRLGEVVGRTLVVDPEACESVDFVAPQVDSDRRISR